MFRRIKEDIQSVYERDPAARSTLEILFNFRYSTETDHDTLQRRVVEILRTAELDYEIEWDHSGLPFLTPAGELITATQAAIQAEP